MGRKADFGTSKVDAEPFTPKPLKLNANILSFGQRAVGFGPSALINDFTWSYELANALRGYLMKFHQDPPCLGPSKVAPF
jgi:hypothetical protein